MDKKKASMVLAATLASGVAAGRLSVTAPESSAQPVAMRWLNEGPEKPARYALAVSVKIEKATAMREVVCAADGSSGRLDGMPEGKTVDEVKSICDKTAKYGQAMTKDVSDLAALLVK